MDKKRMNLIRDALAAGGPDATEGSYKAVQGKVLAAALTPQESLDMAEAVRAPDTEARAAAEAAQRAIDDADVSALSDADVAALSRAKAAADDKAAGTGAARKNFREWLRVQVAAEQGQRFRPAPTTRMIQ